MLSRPIAAAVALGAEEDGEIAVADGGIGGGGGAGLGVIGDAEAGGFEHRDVVGAIADGERGGQGNAGGEERGAFGGGVDDGARHTPGEFAVGNLERVGLVGGEADFGGDGRGEGGEAAGDEQGVGAVGGHGADESPGAGHEADAFAAALVEDGGVHAGEEGNAGIERGFEIQFAAHGGFGDGGDLRLQPGVIGEFVDAFDGDHGGIHVGDEQGFAAGGGGGLDDDVEIGEGGFEGGASGGGIGAGCGQV